VLTKSPTKPSLITLIDRARLYRGPISSFGSTAERSICRHQAASSAYTLMNIWPPGATHCHRTAEEAARTEQELRNATGVCEEEEGEAIMSLKDPASGLRLHYTIRDSHSCFCHR
jgi:hypothetical protein